MSAEEIVINSEEIPNQVDEQIVDEQQVGEQQIDEEEQKKERDRKEYAANAKNRINRLTRERNDERRRAEELAAEIARLRSLEQQPKPRSGGEPNPDNYAAGVFDPGYLDALTDYKSKTAIDEYKKSVMLEEKAKSVASMQQEAKKQYNDYDDSVEQFLDHPVANVKEFNDILMDTENPVELVYYLGKNPEQLERLSEMTIAQATRYIGRLEAQIEQNRNTSQTVAPKPQSSAPKPITPVSGAKSVEATKDPNTMSMDEYVRYRQAK